jgi:transcription elongation GreA/GreB family factor
MNKLTVVQALRATLQAELDAVLRVANMAVEEATHAESKPENKYDTRGLEASYLAAGQARRVGELRQGLAFFDTLVGGDAVHRRVQVGALVCLEEGDETWWCFLSAGGGGSSVHLDGRRVRLLSTRSPAGRALMGCELDDEAAWRTPAGTRNVVVVSVA